MKKFEEIIIPPHLPVSVEERSKAKSVWFPFDYPNNEKGAIVLIKTTKFGWEPVKDVKSIIINFNEN